MSSIMSEAAKYKAFIDCYNDFKLVVKISPEDVCDQLIPLELLPQAVVDYVSNEAHDSGEKASRICNTVASQIKINSDIVFSFTSALEKAGMWTRPAVNKFKKALKNRKQEECKQKINKPLHIQEKRELWG